jgi:elongation factor G
MKVRSETITCVAEVDRSYKRQAGGSGEFARVKIRFEPGPRGSGVVFESAVVGGSVPEQFVPGVRKGIEEASQEGFSAGHPVTDFKAILLDGAYHDLDSTEAAFERAARLAFAALKDLGAPILLP